MNKCLGCGIVLQSDDIKKDGYVSSDKKLCQRCFRMQHYNEYQKTTKDNVDYLKIFKNIPKDSLVVYVSDILNLNLDYINYFSNVLVVITKRDILPKSVSDDKIVSYVKERYKNVDVMLVSSIKNYNLDLLYNKIKKYKKDSVYFVGSTNAGKSTLINKIIYNYSNLDRKVTTSIYPSTTLDEIIIELDDFKLIDTPGIVSNNSIINYLGNELLKNVTPKKEMKPKVYQIKGKGSIIIDNFLRIDYETKESSMVIYMANNLNIYKVYNNDKLKDMKEYEFDLNKNKDLVIEDLGFIKFTNNVKLKLYTYDNVDIRIRDNLI